MGGSGPAWDPLTLGGLDIVRTRKLLSDNYRYRLLKGVFNRLLTEEKDELSIWLDNKMGNVLLCRAAKWLRGASVWEACKSQRLFAKQSFTLASCLLAICKNQTQEVMHIYWMRAPPSFPAAVCSSESQRLDLKFSSRGCRFFESLQQRALHRTCTQELPSSARSLPL